MCVFKSLMISPHGPLLRNNRAASIILALLGRTLHKSLPALVPAPRFGVKFGAVPKKLPPGVTTGFSELERCNARTLIFQKNVALFCTGASTSGVSPPPPPEGEGGVVETGDRLPEPSRKRAKKSKPGPLQNVGRKLPTRIIALLAPDGESLGQKHRSDAIQLADDRSLTIVAIDVAADPPVYQLMTGGQLHELRMSMREQERNAKQPAAMKEIQLSAVIDRNDLLHKTRKIHDWITKGHQVKLTVVHKRRGSMDPADQISVIDAVMADHPEGISFNSEPRAVGKDSKKLMCVLRPLSKKEKLIQSQKNKRKSVEEPSEIIDA